MNTAAILLRLLAGLALGVFFYSALWFTVRSLPAARHPVLLTLGSFWGRTLAVLASFFVLMQGRWEYAAACLAGFMAGRLVVSRMLQPKAFTAGSAENAGDAGDARKARQEQG
ncbi:MAG: ATP synthase subunit I [Acidobacteriia bacterium]|nr:ATP synthase subunit I [Terriglobia bacterium]